MGTVCEDRLARAVLPEALGIGERVQVVTYLGALCAEGVVERKMFGSAMVRYDQGGRRGIARIFTTDQYKFVPVQEDPEDEAAASPGLDEGSASQPEKVQGGGEYAAAADEVPGDTTFDQGPPSMDQLPAAMQTKIMDAAEMSEEDVNKVLSEVGEASMRVLRRLGVKETEIYAKTDKIIQAVRRELGGKGGKGESKTK